MHISLSRLLTHLNHWFRGERERERERWLACMTVLPCILASFDLQIKTSTIQFTHQKQILQTQNQSSFCFLYHSYSPSILITCTPRSSNPNTQKRKKKNLTQTQQTITSTLFVKHTNTQKKYFLKKKSIFLIWTLGFPPILLSSLSPSLSLSLSLVFKNNRQNCSLSRPIQEVELPCVLPSSFYKSFPEKIKNGSGNRRRKRGLQV